MRTGSGRCRTARSSRRSASSRTGRIPVGAIFDIVFFFVLVVIFIVIIIVIIIIIIVIVVLLLVIIVLASPRRFWRRGATRDQRRRVGSQARTLWILQCVGRRRGAGRHDGYVCLAVCERSRSRPRHGRTHSHATAGGPDDDVQTGGGFVGARTNVCAVRCAYGCARNESDAA